MRDGQDPWAPHPIIDPALTAAATPSRPIDVEPCATGWQRRYVEAMIGFRHGGRWRLPDDFTIGAAVATLEQMGKSWRPLLRWGRSNRATRAWLRRQRATSGGGHT